MKKCVVGLKRTKNMGKRIEGIENNSQITEKDIVCIKRTQDT